MQLDLFATSPRQSQPTATIPRCLAGFNLTCQIEGGKKVEEQSDEKDMGMSYAASMHTTVKTLRIASGVQYQAEDELGDLGHLRKVPSQTAIMCILPG